MLVIRFLRVGKKNQPSFKIVVVDKRRSSKSGRFIEEVGFYNPVTKEKVLKGDRIKYWLSKGVQPSPTVHNLLIKEKILEGKKIPKHKKPKKKPASAKTTAGKEEKPEEKKPVPEAKPEAKTEEKPTEKKEVETPQKIEPKKDYNPPTTLPPKGRAPKKPEGK